MAGIVVNGGNCSEWWQLRMVGIVVNEGNCEC